MTILTDALAASALVAITATTVMAVRSHLALRVERKKFDRLRSR